MDLEIAGMKLSRRRQQQVVMSSAMEQQADRPLPCVLLSVRRHDLKSPVFRSKHRDGPPQNSHRHCYFWLAAPGGWRPHSLHVVFKRTSRFSFIDEEFYLCSVGQELVAHGGAKRVGRLGLGRRRKQRGGGGKVRGLGQGTKQAAPISSDADQGESVLLLGWVAVAIGGGCEWAPGGGGPPAACSCVIVGSLMFRKAIFMKTPCIFRHIYALEARKPGGRS
jgi:hypothetical protein